MIGDTFYHRGADSVFQRRLNLEEARFFLNDCHSRACGSHMSRYAIAQKILCAGYFFH